MRSNLEDKIIAVLKTLSGISVFKSGREISTLKSRGWIAVLKNHRYISVLKFGGEISALRSRGKKQQKHDIVFKISAAFLGTFVNELRPKNGKKLLLLLLIAFI